MLGDFRPVLGVAVVLISAVPVAVTAGALTAHAQRLAAILTAEIAAVAARNQTVDLRFLYLPLGLNLAVAELLLHRF